MYIVLTIASLVISDKQGLDLQHDKNIVYIYISAIKGVEMLSKLWDIYHSIVCIFVMLQIYHLSKMAKIQLGASC